MNGQCLVGFHGHVLPFLPSWKWKNGGLEDDWLVSKGEFFSTSIRYGRKGKPMKEFHDTGAEILEKS